MIILNYPVTRTVLAEQVYKISRQTFAFWLKDIGIEHGHTLSPADLRRIIDAYGLRQGVEIRGL